MQAGSSHNIKQPFQRWNLISAVGKKVISPETDCALKQLRARYRPRARDRLAVPVAGCRPEKVALIIYFKYFPQQILYKTEIYKKLHLYNLAIFECALRQKEFSRKSLNFGTIRKI